MDILLAPCAIIASERGQLDLEAFLHSRENDRFALAPDTLAELSYFVQKRPVRYRAAARAFIDRLLVCVLVIPFGRREAENHVLLRLRLEQAGATMGHHDLVVASTALANGMAIAGRGRKFDRIEGLTVIHL